MDQAKEISRNSKILSMPVLTEDNDNGDSSSSKTTSLNSTEHESVNGMNDAKKKISNYEGINSKIKTPEIEVTSSNDVPPGSNLTTSRTSIVATTNNVKNLNTGTSLTKCRTMTSQLGNTRTTSSIKDVISSGNELTTCRTSTSQLAYSSAMTKPICLCIIWVHLQASVSADEAGSEKRHRCMIRKRAKPVSQGHQIVCHHCKSGYLAYNQYLDHLRFSACGIRQQNANKPRLQGSEKPIQSGNNETEANKSQCQKALNNIGSSFYSKPGKIIVNHSSRTNQDANADVPFRKAPTSLLQPSNPLPPLSSLFSSRKRKSSLNEAYLYNGQEHLFNKQHCPPGPKLQSIHRPDWPPFYASQSASQFHQQQQQHMYARHQQVSYPMPAAMQHRFNQAGYFENAAKPGTFYIAHPQRFQLTPVRHQPSYYCSPQGYAGPWSPAMAPMPQLCSISAGPHHPQFQEQFIQRPNYYSEVQGPGMYVYHNGMEAGWGRSIADPVNFSTRLPNNGEWSYYSNNTNALNKQGQESGGCFNGFSHPQVLTIPPLVHTTPSNRSNNVQQIFRDNFEQNSKPIHETGREIDVSRINFVGMPTDVNMVTSTYQGWSQNAESGVGERELNAELVEFAVERGEDRSQEHEVALTTVEIESGENGIEIISENDVNNSLTSLGSFTHFVGNLDNLVYFNEDEICGEVLESFHIQDDLIQQAVDVSGVDQEFCISANDGQIVDAVEVLPSPNDFEGRQVEKQNDEEGDDLNGNCFTPANCMKEGSEDPVLTATAPQLSNIESIKAMSNVATNDLSATTTPYQQSHDNDDNETSAEGCDSTRFEVVVTNKDTAAGPDETVTLHYSLEEDGSNNNLFDEVAASETLLLLSESGERKQGLIRPSGDESGSEHCMCPHRATLELPEVSLCQQAKDQLKLICLQAQLGYVLLGLMGEKRLRNYGYPHQSVIHILHKVLDVARTKIVEENYNCQPDCQELDRNLDQDQLTCRLIKLRIRVLRANIGKLFLICVPVRQKWCEFGWVGKSVDDILEELTREEIPNIQPGDKPLLKEKKKVFKLDSNKGSIEPMNEEN